MIPPMAHWALLLTLLRRTLTLSNGCRGNPGTRVYRSQPAVAELKPVTLARRRPVNKGRRENAAVAFFAPTLLQSPFNHRILAHYMIGSLTVFFLKVYFCGGFFAPSK